MLQVDCLCTLARRSARSLTDIYDRAMEPSGLKVTQYSLLRSIDRLDSPSLTELSDATGLDRSTLGRNLRILEKSGLVKVSQGEDGRTRVANLTAKAKKALSTAEPLWLAVQARVGKALPKESKDFLESLNARLEVID